MLSITKLIMAEKKPGGIRHKIYADKKRMRRIYTIITLLIIISIIVLVSYYLATSFVGSDSSTNENGENSGDSSLKAALIDALYVTLPNDEFTRSLTETLQEAGFEVDVFQGTEVTVDFLKTVPNGYKLVILRMHSALHEDQLYLFTAEPYSVGKYTQEQQFQLVKEAYATEESQPVFAVNWGFVKRCMTGKFNGTLVIAMGCDGTLDQLIIEEFMNQGAFGYISWNGPVLISHSDTAILHLTEVLYLEKLSVAEAIEITNNQVGADPEHGVVLEYHAP
ncbi:MAG: hypothetical protein PVH73_05890 [Candidatus Bathyarchaeota archaeon]|jgi:hypothetical protein